MASRSQRLRFSPSLNNTVNIMVAKFLGRQFFFRVFSLKNISLCMSGSSSSRRAKNHTAFMLSDGCLNYTEENNEALVAGFG